MNATFSDLTLLTDAELDLVSGGDLIVAANPILLQAAREAAEAYKASPRAALGSFPPPHVPVPRF